MTNQPNRVLLVWEEIPENTRFFVFEKPTEEQLAALNKAHSHTINGDDDGTLVDNLANMLLWDDEGETVQPPSNVREVKLVNEKTLVPTQPLQGPFDLVFWAGFVL